MRVCVVGSGWRFTSGISYYTHRLANALAERHEVSVVLMRRLLPRRLYPGRDRVGSELTRLRYPDSIPTFDGVDWFGIPSLVRAVAFLVRRRPEVVVLQWWTGTVLHSYIALALVARLIRARVVIEFHEVLDTGELNIAPARWYVRLVAPVLIRLTHGAVVHSGFDAAQLAERYPVATHPTALIPHGPYDHVAAAPAHPASGGEGPVRLLYFGVIRPFKGVEDLLRAFETLPEDEIDGYELTIAGETWEGWTLPAELIELSRYRDRITFVNRYVSDDEVDELFANTDAVVLPYHRSSSSGPLQLTMAQGLPVIVTAVGGLVEAVENYDGALQVPPQDPDAIRAAIRRVASMKGERFTDPHSWERTIERYDELFDRLLNPPATATLVEERSAA
jgi:glycosyltransferase involved in cell wall biosynthesis